MSGSREFTVGDLAFRLDGATGMVRAIRFRGHEVVRGIQPAVRGAGWETLPPEVAPAVVESCAQHVRLQLSARVVSSAISLVWQAQIEADARGTLRYHWQGRAQLDSLTNRAGLCVLHPAEAAGAFCTLEHHDGSTSTGRFPLAISPHQPFQNIRCITHRFAAGGEVSVRCEGEVFEMEDQRNWTDASFKTYCRPLDWPKPYPLSAGTIIDHTVTVTIRGECVPPLTAPRDPPRLSSTPVPLRWPRIGFGLRDPLPPALRERARQLRPSHVHVETRHDRIAATLNWAAPEAAALDCELELAVLDATRTPPPRADLPARCTVFLFDAAGNRAASDVVAAWRNAGFESIATGTRHHFAELNRARPPVDDAHSLTAVGINAQVHAFDDRSVLETLSQHRVVAQQAASLGGNRPVAVAPILLGPSRGADDPRLHAGFGALWTLGSLAQLAGTGSVARTTYFQLHGPGGILREGSPPSPLELLLRRIAHVTRVDVLPVEPGDTAGVTALLVHTGSHRQLLICHDGENAIALHVPFGIGRVTLAPRAVQSRSLSA